jgi:uncharacterized membrane protein
MQARRLQAVDAARGLAVLAMFVAHGYDGWVAEPYKVGLAYRVTRELAAVAMPAFVLLAGVALGLRLRSAAAETRWAIVARGLQLILTGYALSLAYALIDRGLTPATLLRSDALHAIGASLTLVALLLASGTRRPRQLELRALLVSAALLLATPWLTRTLQDAQGALSYPLALFVRIDGLTRFAAFPLAALCAAGVALAGTVSARLVTTRAAYLLTAGAALGAGACALATSRTLEALGGTLSPAHLAVLPNALDGLCRGTCALGLGTLVARQAPDVVRSSLQALGQRSLWVYALHLPLCYGRLAMPLRGRLDLSAATLAVGALAFVASGLAGGWRKREPRGMAQDDLGYPLPAHGPARAPD